MILTNVSAQQSGSVSSPATNNFHFVSPQTSPGAGIPPYSHVVEYVLNGSRAGLLISRREQSSATVYIFGNSVVSSGPLKVLRSPVPKTAVRMEDEIADWPSNETDGQRFFSTQPARYARFRR